MLLLGTYRDTEPDSAAIVTLTAERRLVLGGLSAEDLALAVAELTGEAIAPDAAAAPCIAAPAATRSSPPRSFACSGLRAVRCATGNVGAGRRARGPRPASRQASGVH